MTMNRKWMILLLLLGVMILSGCGISKETMLAYNEAKDAFQKATLAGAKKCAPCEYATAEAYLAHADHEVSEIYGEDHSTHLKNAITITREKSLEAIKLCQAPPAPMLSGPQPGAAPAALTAPVIDSFTATPDSITSGGSSTLAWTLSGGAPTTLTIDNGVGNVLGSTSTSVSPTETTTYTLTASNSAGSATRSTTVTVTPGPAPAPGPTPAPAPGQAPVPTPVPGPAPAPAPAPGEITFEPVYFNVNKSNISPVSSTGLDHDGMLLKDNPSVKVEIGGHTDSGGSEKANLKISEKRALSVKKYLEDKFNISGDRMTVKAYGSSKPIADNKTQEGRSKNRRVEIKVISK